MANPTLGTATLRTSLDASGLNQGLSRARGQTTQTFDTLDARMRQTGQRMQSLGTKLSLGLTAPIAAIGALSLKAASDAEETEAKFRTVFSNIGNQAEASADRLSNAYGQSDQAAQALLANTGDLLTGFGFTQEAALDLSTQVNELAVDLASFTNFSGGAEGASQALTKALLGEREAAKSLGIAITEDVVNAKIEELEATGDLVGASERQKEAYATLLVAQEQSKNAIGDFARTQDSFANQTRILNSHLDDLRVALGEGILPIVTPLVGGLADMAEGLADMSDSARNAVLIIGGGAAASGPLLLGLGGIVSIAPKVVAGLRAIRTAMLFMGPAGLLFTAASVVTGLAIALSGDGQKASLEDAIDDVNEAADDTAGLENLDATLNTLADSLEGRVATAFQNSIDDIWELVNNAEDGAAALREVQIGAQLAEQISGDRPLRSALASAVNIETGSALARTQDALVLGDFTEAADIAKNVLRDYEAFGSDRDVEALQRFIAELESAEARIAAIGEGGDGRGDGRGGRDRDSAPPAGPPRDDDRGARDERTVVDALQDAEQRGIRANQRALALIEAGADRSDAVGDALRTRVRALDSLLTELIELGAGEDIIANTAQRLAERQRTLRVLERESGTPPPGLLQGGGRAAEPRALSAPEVRISSERTTLETPQPIAGFDTTPIRERERAQRRAENALTTEAQLRERLNQAIAQSRARGLGLEPVPTATPEVGGDRQALPVPSPQASLDQRTADRLRREDIRGANVAQVARFTSQEWTDAFMNGIRRRMSAAGQTLALEVPDVTAGRPEPRALPVPEPTAIITPPPTEQTRLEQGISSEERARIREGGIEADREAAELERRSAEEFRDTVIAAGASFATDLATAIESGDIGGAVESLFGAGGQIAASFAGPFGPLVQAGAGILGGIFGSLFGGGDDQQRQREEARARSRSVPAININFSVSQDIDLHGGPQQPQVEQALRRHATAMIDEFMNRTRIVQRIEALEGAA